MDKIAAIQEACQHLKNGGIILCPSDTIWGISCDATNAEALEKIIKLKTRADNKSFIVLVNSDAMINNCIKEIPEVVWDLIDLSDSPLSIVMEATSYVAKNAIGNDGTLAIRKVKAGFIHELLQAYRKPIVSTSANISGEKTALNFKEISPAIVDGVDYVVPLSYGSGLSGKASKIISVKASGEVKIIRN